MYTDSSVSAEESFCCLWRTRYIGNHLQVSLPRIITLSPMLHFKQVLACSQMCIVIGRLPRAGEMIRRRSKAEQISEILKKCLVSFCLWFNIDRYAGLVVLGILCVCVCVCVWVWMCARDVSSYIAETYSRVLFHWGLGAPIFCTKHARLRWNLPPKRFAQVVSTPALTVQNLA